MVLNKSHQHDVDGLTVNVVILGLYRHLGVVNLSFILLGSICKSTILKMNKSSLNYAYIFEHRVVIIFNFDL